jgi:soluble lytic murein transglycosylase-like protein
MNGLLMLVYLYSALYNLDPVLVESIIEVESGFQSDRIGALGELGMMQLRPEYFYHKDLAKPEINLQIGIAYLAEVKEQCKHKEDNTFIVCYNAGVTGGNRIKYPKKQSYYKRVMKLYDTKRRQSNAKDSTL